MSGVEILGFAASVIQVADIGLKLSIKLYTFTRKLKQADKHIDALAHEIATTGAILQNLGETLSETKVAQLCKPQAVSTAKQLLEDCRAVFQRLEKIIEDGTNKKLKISIKQRFVFLFRESEVEEFRANVERLKSSMLVILQVLGLAELLRNRETPPVVRDQRDLLQALIEESAANQKRYDELYKLIKANGESNSVQSNSSTLTLVTDPSEPPQSKGITANAIPIRAAESDSSYRTVDEMSMQNKHLPVPRGMRHHTSKIVDHGSLVTALLEEVASQRYKIDHAHRMGLHNGILDIHWNAWSSMRRLYGHEVFLKLFSDFHSTDVYNHWTDQSLSASQFGGPGFTRDKSRSIKFDRNAVPYECTYTPSAAFIPRPYRTELQRPGYHPYMGREAPQRQVQPYLPDADRTADRKREPVSQKRVSKPEELNEEEMQRVSKKQRKVVKVRSGHGDSPSVVASADDAIVLSSSSENELEQKRRKPALGYKPKVERLPVTDSPSSMIPPTSALGSSLPQSPIVLDPLREPSSQPIQSTRDPLHAPLVSVPATEKADVSEDEELNMYPDIDDVSAQASDPMDQEIPVLTAPAEADEKDLDYEVEQSEDDGFEALLEAALESNDSDEGSHEYNEVERLLKEFSTLLPDEIKGLYSD